ncbi:MAG TPA: hypothetical protein VF538_09435 [Pyrinomonadaceae bacterium]|jgi:hypothetical protein
MRRRNLALVSAFALAVCLCGALSAAQAKPDFTGSWKWNQAKSQVGPGFHPITSLRFEQKGETFAEEVSVDAPGGAKTFTLKYALDGKETPGKVLGKSMTLSAKRDGDALVIRWRDEVEDYTVTRRLTLSADGRTLEMTIREIAPEHQREDRVVLERQQ